ncbi:hypothetical protein DFH08DRAFT_1052151 [Mycena albidolilacea]|uniref:Uncharacterized protein n=1 Tax=Mycena albidolilacea TaxID=1033008 RepID=A0AAD7ACQ1_9AGAR|nr:hypothetical protein DFH08DRAFT_1052151 [Mycena albidolilacea]
MIETGPRSKSDRDPHGYMSSVASGKRYTIQSCRPEHRRNRSGSPKFDHGEVRADIQRAVGPRSGYHPENITGSQLDEDELSERQGVWQRRSRKDGDRLTRFCQAWSDPSPNAGSDDFFVFCGAVTSTNSTLSAVDSQLSKYTGGVIWKNLGNYANYIKANIVPLCPPGVDLDSNECFGTHNATAFANPFDLSGDRAYLYQSCLESGQWSQGAPLGRRTLLSRSIQTDYTQRWCQWSFPDGQFNKIPASPMLERWNKFGALRLQADRLAQVDGGIDPWQYACVHSPDGFKRTNTLLRPYYEIKEGGHHWDENGLLNITAEPDFIQAIHKYEIKTVRKKLAGRFSEMASWAFILILTFLFGVRGDIEDDPLAYWNVWL